MTVAQNLHDVSAPEPLRPKPLRPMRETERRILDAIRRHPGQSRAELARRLDYSRALMTQSVTTFLEEGWITEQRDHVPARRGQPALRLSVRKAAIAGLGLSLSTGGMRAAAVDLSGTVLGTAQSAVSGQNWEAGSAAAVALVEGLLGQADSFAGLTIWAPAMINKSGEIEEVTPSQSGVDFIAYRQLLEDRFGLPVALESKCPSIDEAMFSSDLDDLVFMLFLDYGIGGSLIDGMRVFRGGFGQAVNIGALVPDSGIRPSLPDLATFLGLSQSEPDPDHILSLQEKNDPRLRHWIETRGAALSDPLSIVVQFFNPTDIVLNGMFPRSVLAGLAEQVDLTRYDAPGRFPIRKPKLRVGRNVGAGSLAATAGSTSLFRVLVSERRT